MNPQPEQPPYPADWLALREPADAAGRSLALFDLLRERLEPRTGNADRPLVIRDLGCGTGSMTRWLAPRLPGPQHWVLQDRDPALLAVAEQSLPDSVTFETVCAELSDLSADDLRGTDLVTGSALLDILTEPEIRTIATACAGAGAAGWFTLSVLGIAQFLPQHPYDREIGDAFNEHQERDGRMGRAAVSALCGAFDASGNRNVQLRESVWWLGPEHPELGVRWLREWCAAAVEQRPELAVHVEDYLEDRFEQEFRIRISHLDALYLP